MYCYANNNLNQNPCGCVRECYFFYKEHKQHKQHFLRLMSLSLFIFNVSQISPNSDLFTVWFGKYVDLKFWTKKGYVFYKSIISRIRDRIWLILFKKKPTYFYIIFIFGFLFNIAANSWKKSFSKKYFSLKCHFFCIFKALSVRFCNFFF